MYIPKINGYELREHFSNCDLSTVQTEGRLIAVNEKFLAMSWKNDSGIVIADSSKPLNLKDYQPNIKGFSNLLDLEFSPFNNNILSFCDNSNTGNSVRLWKISENELTKEMLNYKEHTKKVNFVNFNPVVPDLICSGALAGEIHVWNLTKGEKFMELKADETPTIVTWNPKGVLIGATTKKKNINIFDPRAKRKEPIHKQKINESFMGTSKFVWIDDNLFATTSWDNDQKELKIWDIREITKSCEKKVISKSNNTSTLFVDRELKLLYITTKSETTINIYDYNEGIFKPKPSSKCNESVHYSVLFDRKCLDKKKLEIDKFAIYYKSKNIYYISFTIQDKTSDIQNYYPSLDSKDNILTYEEWTKFKNIDSNKLNNIEDKIEIKEKKEEKKEKNNEIF